jgi:K+-transporting ATPase ATPase B chain
MKKIYQWAIGESFKKLDPRQQIKNPVMFVVYLGAILTTILCFQEQTVPLWFSISVTVFLWLTLLFANFAEAVAEGRGKAQADSLKQAKKDIMTYKFMSLEDVAKEAFIEVRFEKRRLGVCSIWRTNSCRWGCRGRCCFGGRKCHHRRISTCHS